MEGKTPGQQLAEVPEKPSYYKELNPDGSILSISQYNKELTEKNGICYEFLNGRVEAIKKYSHGEVELFIASFEENKIRVMDHGVQKYFGEYSGDYIKGFEKCGHGVEYDENGESVIYDGEFQNDQRNGQGMFYSNGYVRYKGAWKNGVPSGIGTVYDDQGILLKSGNNWVNGYLKVSGGYLYYGTGRKERTCSEVCLPHWRESRKNLYHILPKN